MGELGETPALLLLSPADAAANSQGERNSAKQAEPQHIMGADTFHGPETDSSDTDSEGDADDADEEELNSTHDVVDFLFWNLNGIKTNGPRLARVLAEYPHHLGAVAETKVPLLPEELRCLSYEYRMVAPSNTQQISADLNHCGATACFTRMHDGKGGVVSTEKQVENFVVLMADGAIYTAEGPIAPDGCPHLFRPEYKTVEDVICWMSFFSNDTAGCSSTYIRCAPDESRWDFRALAPAMDRILRITDSFIAKQKKGPFFVAGDFNVEFEVAMAITDEECARQSGTENTRSFSRRAIAAVHHRLAHFLSSRGTLVQYAGATCFRGNSMESCDAIDWVAMIPAGADLSLTAGDPRWELQGAEKIFINAGGVPVVVAAEQTDAATMEEKKCSFETLKEAAAGDHVALRVRATRPKLGSSLIKKPTSTVLMPIPRPAVMNAGYAEFSPHDMTSLHNRIVRLSADEVSAPAELRIRVKRNQLELENLTDSFAEDAKVTPFLPTTIDESDQWLCRWLTQRGFAKKYVAKAQENTDATGPKNGSTMADTQTRRTAPDFIKKRRETNRQAEQWKGGYDGSEQGLWALMRSVQNDLEGQKKGAPAGTITRLQVGQETVEGLEECTRCIALQHLLKLEGIQKEYGQPLFAQDAAAFGDMMRALRRVAGETIRPSVTRTKLRRFLSRANKNLQGLSGLRLQAYRALSDEALDTMAGLYNEFLEKVAMLQPGRELDHLLTDLLLTIQVEVLRKTPSVEKVDKLRCVIKGCPGLRILTGVLGDEVAALMEENDAWGEMALGGRRSVGTLTALLRWALILQSLGPEQLLLMVGIDFANFFNCLQISHLAETFAAAGVSPFIILFFATINYHKRMIIRNGDCFMEVKGHRELVQGSVEVMHTGTALLTAHVECMANLLEEAFNPEDGRIRAERLPGLRERAAALDVRSKRRKWTNYSTAEVDPAYRNSAGKGLPHGRPIPQWRRQKKRRFVLTQYVDDGTLFLKIHRDDLPLVPELLKIVSLLVEVMFVQTGQFFAKSKFEFTIRQGVGAAEPGGLSRDASTENTDTSATANMGNRFSVDVQKLQQAVTGNLRPFDCTPHWKDVAIFLGFPFGEKDDAAAFMGTVKKKLQFALVKIARVEAQAKGQLTGDNLRLAIIWAVYSQILHFLFGAVLFWGDQEWADLLTEVSCQIFYVTGYTKTQLEWLLWKEKLARREVYKLLFAEEFLDVPDPLLLMTRCVRTTAQKYLTLQPLDRDLVHYAFLPLRTGGNSKGLDHEQTHMLQSKSAADAAVREVITSVPIAKPEHTNRKHYDAAWIGLDERLIRVLDRRFDTKRAELTCVKEGNALCAVLALISGGVVRRLWKGRTQECHAAVIPTGIDDETTRQNVAAFNAALWLLREHKTARQMLLGKSHAPELWVIRGFTAALNTHGAYRALQRIFEEEFQDELRAGALVIEPGRPAEHNVFPQITAADNYSYPLAVLDLSRVDAGFKCPRRSFELPISLKDLACMTLGERSETIKTACEREGMEPGKQYKHQIVRSRKQTAKKQKDTHEQGAIATQDGFTQSQL
eukprot:g5877.t1